MLSHRVLRRALAVSGTTLLSSSALMFGAPAASAAQPSTYCPQATSTRLVTANEGQYKVWLYQPSGNEIDVCFAFDPSTAAGRFRFRGLGGGLVPTVTPSLNDPTCPQYLGVQDPVELITRLELSLSNPYSVCFGVGTSAIRVTVATSGSGTPDPDLFLDGYTTLAWAYCNHVALDFDGCWDEYFSGGVQIF